MEPGFWNCYLISANIIGFLACAVNTWLRRHTAGKQIHPLLTLLALSGGAAGILLFMALFDRKATKDNMLFRVFTVCVLVIQVVLLLILKGHIRDSITLDFWAFFGRHKLLIGYLAAVNLAAFAAFAFDKLAAIRQKPRIRIVTLLALAFLGGSPGAFIAMYALRHKTRTACFTVGIPLIMVTQVMLTFYLMNAPW